MLVHGDESDGDIKYYLLLIIQLKTYSLGTSLPVHEIFNAYLERSVMAYAFRVAKRVPHIGEQSGSFLYQINFERGIEDFYSGSIKKEGFF